MVVWTVGKSSSTLWIFLLHPFTAALEFFSISSIPTNLLSAQAVHLASHGRTTSEAFQSEHTVPVPWTSLTFAV